MINELKILIIDDNQADANLLRRLLIKLEHWKLNIQTVSSGDDAKALLTNYTPHIVFVDYLLGGENGIELIKQLKQIETNAAFILLTGFGSETLAAEALRIGASDYIRKDDRSLETLDRTIRHIVAKSEAELKLKQTEYKLQNVLAKTGTGLLILSATGQILDMNEALMKMVGAQNIESIYQKFVINWILQEYRPLFQKSFDHCLANGFVTDFETGYMRQDRSAGFLIISATKEEIDNQITISAICRDITPQKKAEEAMRRSEASLRFAQQIAHLGNWELSIDPPAYAWSEELYHIFGINILTFNGNLRDYYLAAIHQDYKDLIANTTQEIIATGKDTTIEYKIVLPDGTLKYVKDESRCVSNNEGKKLIGTIQDITNQKLGEIALKQAKEKAEQSDRLKSAFLSNLSHEIRTPMNAIVGFSNLLDGPTLNDEQHYYIEQINKGTKTLLNLIEDLIDIAKIETNEFRIDYEQINLNSLLYEVYEKYYYIRNDTDKPDVTLKINVPTHYSNLIIEADSFHLRRVLSNLIDNALKFTEIGIVEFGYELQEDKVVIYVKDTGVGIPADKFNLIFERFTKIEDDKSKLFRGAGLGLALAKRIIEYMGGNIWVESELGRGSTFYFTLLCRKKNPDKFENDFFNNKTILIAENDTGNYSYTEGILRKTGISILWVTDGLSAVESCILDNDINLVLMEIDIPSLNGHEAAQRIKMFRNNLPIIAFISDNQHHNERATSENNFDAVITKPYSPRDLLTIIADNL